MDTYLIVNDDGIDSPMLHALVHAFSKVGKVVVAAPKHEQSWVGKCMSRFKEVCVEERNDLPCQAYSISGSPADCVNLALGHLLPEKPTAVISGINIGHNAGLAYILSSGTVGAALEGALHDIPSFAASMGLDRNDYDRLKEDPIALGNELGAKAAKAAEILVDFSRETITQGAPHYAIVHSLNFPTAPLDHARIAPANPALTQAGSFFQYKQSGYSFAYQELKEKAPSDPSDRNTLKSGNISYSRLDFSQLGRIV